MGHAHRALLTLVPFAAAHIELSVAGGARCTIWTLAGVGGAIVQAEATLAGVPVTHPLLTLLDISPSQRQRYSRHGRLLAALRPPCHHNVKNAAGEAGVNRQVVRQASEVEVLVAAHKKFPIDIEAGQPAGRHAGNVGKVVHLEPGCPPPPPRMHGVNVDPVVHRRLGEDPPRASAQVPGEQDVALDVADGQVVGALAVGPLLALVLMISFCKGSLARAHVLSPSMDDRDKRSDL